MKYFTAATLIIIALLSFSSLAANDTPTEIGGFKLGEFITDYPQIEYSEYLKEVVVNDWHGFRKGIISYGTCAYPGRIVKIRMKYQNSSKDFYDELLQKLIYQTRFRVDLHFRTNGVISFLCQFNFPGNLIPLPGSGSILIFHRIFQF